MTATKDSKVMTLPVTKNPADSGDTAGLAMVYFKPTGTTLQKRDFLARFRPSPVNLELVLESVPQFSDTEPVLTFHTQARVRIEVDLTFDNSDSAFGIARPAEYAVLQDTGLPAVTKDSTGLETPVSFNLPGPVLEETTAEGAADLMVAVFPSDMLFFERKLVEPIASSMAFRLLVNSKNEEGVGAKSDSFYAKIGDFLGRYGEVTKALIDVQNRPIIDPANPPPPNPAAVGDLVETPPPVGGAAETTISMNTAAISPQEIEAMRARRTKIMDQLRITFAQLQTLRFNLPVSTLSSYPLYADAIRMLLPDSSVPLDVAIAREVRQLLTNTFIVID